MNTNIRGKPSNIFVCITSVCLLLCVAYVFILFGTSAVYTDTEFSFRSNPTLNNKITVNEVRKQVELVGSNPGNGNNPVQPPGTTNPTPTPILSGTVSEAMWHFLLDKGYDEYAAAGILGNACRESSFYPNSIEGKHSGPWEDLDTGCTAYGVGLFQWTSPGRKTNFRNYVSSAGTDWTDTATQLNFFWQEVSSGYTKVLPAKLNGHSIRDCTLLFHDIYEGSADSAQMLEMRIGYAQDAYNTYAGTYKPNGGGNS